MSTPDNATRALVTATAVGTILQLAMVILGHSNPTIASLFAVGGMGISLAAGALYAMVAHDGAWKSAAGKGALAGGLCAVIGIAVSFALGDVTAMILAVGTLSSALTGAIGGSAGALLSGSSEPAADRAR